MSRDFDGVDDRVRITTVPAGLLLNVLTACAWVRADAGDGTVAILREDVANFDETGWNIYINSSGLPRIEIDTTAGVGQDAATGTTVVTAGGWHHVCITYDSGAANPRGRLYVDGVQEATLTATGTTVQYGAGTKRLDLGFYTGASIPFNGRIAEFGYWNAVLNAVEINALAKGVSPLRIRTANIKAHMPLWGAHSPEVNLVSADVGTITGALTAAHAPVAPPFAGSFGWRGAFTAAGAPPPSGRSGQLLLMGVGA